MIILGWRFGVPPLKETPMSCIEEVETQTTKTFSPRNLQRSNPRSTDSEKTWVSNSSITTYWKGSIGKVPFKFWWIQERGGCRDSPRLAICQPFQFSDFSLIKRLIPRTDVHWWYPCEAAWPASKPTSSSGIGWPNRTQYGFVYFPGVPGECPSRLKNVKLQGCSTLNISVVFLWGTLSPDSLPSLTYAAYHFSI